MKSFSMILPPIAALILALSIPVDGQSGGPYDLRWNSIDGGGGLSAGGPYTLAGTIGQPDAAYSRGGDYEMLGGFMPGEPLCIVDFDDFARFAGLWLYTGDRLASDLDNDKDVDFGDVQEFADLWLWHCPDGWPLE